MASFAEEAPSEEAKPCISYAREKSPSLALGLLPDYITQIKAQEELHMPRIKWCVSEQKYLRHFSQQH